MKFTWEESDVVPGRTVALPHKGGEQFIVGYQPGQAPYNNRCLVSMADGALVQCDKSNAEIAAALNEGGYVPLSLK
jgi:hypothetical protein